MLKTALHTTRHFRLLIPQRILSRDYTDLYYHWVGIEDTGDGNGFKYLDGSDIYKNAKWVMNWGLVWVISKRKG